MILAFKLTSNFSVKLEYDLLKKADGTLGYGTFALSSGFIEYLMIQLINITIQAAYSKSACN